MGNGTKYQILQYCEGIQDRKDQKFIYSKNVINDAARARALVGVFVCSTGEDFSHGYYLERWLDESAQKSLIEDSRGEFVRF